LTTIQKISALLLLFNPILTWSQDYNALLTNPYHSEKVKMQFVNHPLLSDKLKSTSPNDLIVVFTKNCSEGLIEADSIQFSFQPTDSLSKNKTAITIIPDTLTTFSSHIFAYMLYEHAEIFEKPKNGKKPIFTTIETDEFDSLLFLDQRIDKKGRIWYLVQFNSDRKDNVSRGKQIKGWTLRGRSRLIFWGSGCF
jgi:hypothetical protein